jgi:hypothetical protein
MKNKLIKYLFGLGIVGCIVPHLALGNSMIVSTVKTPDIYSNNLSWFRYYQYPGTTVKDSLILRNIGEHEETVRLYAADATVNQAGSFTPKLESEEQNGIGLWSTLSDKEVTLEPGESIEIPFSIEIPLGIAPGQYFGSIINEQVNTGTCPNGLLTNGNGECPGNIQIKTRTGNRIYLTIPGEIKHDITLRNLLWKSSSQKKILFTFNFTNNGNVAFEPQAVLHIYDTWGRELKTLESRLGKSLPGSSTAPMMEWDPGDSFGSFTVKAEIYYREDDQGRFDSLHGTVLTETLEVKVFIFPWALAIVTLAVATLIGLGMLGRKRYYTSLLHRAFDYTVQEGDTVISIAKRQGVRWQTIAKINKLRAPFVIEPNQSIKIPTSSKNKHE